MDGLNMNTARWKLAQAIAKKEANDSVGFAAAQKLELLPK